jgi:hypothetical protein
MAGNRKNSDIPDKDTILKYLQGKLPPEEAHRIEKLMMNDSFYQEAMDGIESLKDGQFEEDITELSSRIQKKAQARKYSYSYIYRAAAVIALLAVFTYVIIFTTSRIDRIFNKEVVTQKMEEANLSSEKSDKEEISPSELEDMEQPGLKPEEADMVEDRQEPLIADMEEEEPGPEPETAEEQFIEENQVSRSTLTVQKGQGLEVAKDTEMVEEIDVDMDIEIAEEEKPKTNIENVEKESDIIEYSLAEESIEQSKLTNNALATDEVKQDKFISQPIPMAAENDVKLKSKRARLQDDEIRGARKIAAASPAIGAEDELKPIPSTGYEAYSKYILENLQYPVFEIENNIEGIVELQFIINNDSIPSKFKIIQTLSENCDREAIRLLEEGPKWMPVFSEGQLKEVEVNYIISFELED